jgi:hypothetical protein
MKKLLLALVVPVMFFSCGDDSEPVPNVTGQWELISIKHGWTGEELIGTDVDPQSTYQFRSNGTFRKSQKSDGQVLEASGNYSTFPEEDTSSANVRLYVALEFIEGEEIAESCSGSAAELLALRGNNQLQNTWDQCDGPALSYMKN